MREDGERMREGGERRNTEKGRKRSLCLFLFAIANTCCIPYHCRIHCSLHVQKMFPRFRFCLLHAL